MTAHTKNTAILTLGVGPDQQSALLFVDERPPVSGTFRVPDPSWLSQLEKTLEGAEAVPRGGDDARWVAAERVYQRALLDILAGPGMQAINARLIELRQHHHPASAPLDLFLDLRPDPLGQANWEMLDQLPPSLSPGGPWRIWRLGARQGKARAPAGERIEVLVADIDAASWHEPGKGRDSILQTRSSALHQLLDELHILGTSAGSRSAAAQLSTPAVMILHILTSSVEATRALLDAASVKTRSRRIASPSHPDARTVGTDIVVFEPVAEPGDRTTHFNWPFERFLSAGAFACLSFPRCPGQAASDVFFRVFYTQLSGGNSLCEAVAQGRRALAYLAGSRRAERWWNPCLHVSAIEGGVVPVLITNWCARLGWRGVEVDAEVESLLRAAWSLACRQGFLGVEHIAAALSRVEEPSAFVLLLKPVFGELGGSAVGFGNRETSRPIVTPRLLALMDGVRERVTLDGFLRLLVRTSTVVQRLPPVMRAHLVESFDSSGTLGGSMTSGTGLLADDGSAMVYFEVLGGPEDGRVAGVFSPGEFIGRWDPEVYGDHSDGALYREPVHADRTVSRHHLRYLGDSRFDVLAPAQIVRAGKPPRALHGAVSLAPGDVVQLGTSTLIRVLSLSGADDRGT